VAIRIFERRRHGMEVVVQAEALEAQIPVAGHLVGLLAQDLQEVQ
jgi:hypothetical protein